MDAIKLLVRISLSGLAGVLTLLATMTAACDDIGGVPTWERCTTWLGNPSFVELPFPLDLVVPLSLGLAVAFAVWWLLGHTPLRTPR